jgi:Zn-dependent M32 family carboxypeptidase
MQIDSIGNGYQGALALSPVAPPERSAATATAALEGASGTGGDGSSFQEILAHFDVTQITPREFSELIQKLQEAGTINDAEAKELAQIRVEIDKTNAEPDEPIDLVNFFQQKLKSLEQQWSDQQQKGAEASAALPNREAILAPVRRQLDWIQKFATIHGEKSTEPVDLVA